MKTRLAVPACVNRLRAMIAGRWEEIEERRGKRWAA
jgi:hypothetical protein